jgi:uncharacterized damage-inducible protein DinB
MITPAYAQTMARYNAWQNRSHMAAADTLDDAARRADRGAFFGSITATLSHLLWGDSIWLARFGAGDPPPGTPRDSAALYDDWATYKATRTATDAHLIAWADALTPADLAGDLGWYSGVLGREVSKPRAVIITHIFNHQTHHRGQVHAMLTAAGARPDDTDLIFMPDPA